MSTFRDKALLMRKQAGFTLLEMIVAIAIFAVIAVISYGSLNRFLENSAVIEAELKQIKQLQLAFSLLEQDMHFISGRAVRDDFGDLEPLFLLNKSNSSSYQGELLRFTTARRDWRLPSTSVLQRAAYRWEDGRLIRMSWSVLDRDQDSKPIEHHLLDKVESVTVKVIKKVDGVLVSGADWDSVGALPDGIEWTIRLENGNEYRRVFEVKHAL